MEQWTEEASTHSVYLHVKSHKRKVRAFTPSLQPNGLVQLVASAHLLKKEEGIQELSIGISLPLGFGMLPVKGVSGMFFSAWPAPKMNSCGEIF